MSKFIDLHGHKFGKLTPIRFVTEEQKWECSCDCGGSRRTTSRALRDGKAKTCGCHHSTATHGMSGTPEFQAWMALKKRCYNPSHPQYSDYGGRGIQIAAEWRNDFLAFYRDMGPRPAGVPGQRVYSIDRIDNSLGYFNGNCRWATQTEQQRNRRSNRPIEFRGETKLLVEWAAEIGIKETTLAYRLAAGWPLERALTPARKYGR